eukprot:scaffold7067_cov245-Pinguiococcus_pyrenoidosus.AAC.2
MHKRTIEVKSYTFNPGTHAEAWTPPEALAHLSISLEASVPLAEEGNSQLAPRGTRELPTYHPQPIVQLLILRAARRRGDPKHANDAVAASPPAADGESLFDQRLVSKADETWRWVTAAKCRRSGVTLASYALVGLSSPLLRYHRRLLYDVYWDQPALRPRAPQQQRGGSSG